MLLMRTCYGIDSREDLTIAGEKPAEKKVGDLIVVRAERIPWPKLWARRARRNRVNYTAVFPDDPSFVEEIRDSKVVVGCLSVRESFTRWLEAPFAASSKAQKVFPTLLDIQLPFALEDCIYSFLNMSRVHPKDPLDKKATRALAVAARLADVEKKLESFKALGIDPIVLDHEGLALWTQSLRELPVQPETIALPRVVICLNSGRSTLVIGRGEEFLGAHSVRYEDSSQINRLLKTYQGSADVGDPQSVTQWVYTGPGARDTELVKELHERLGKDWPGPSFVHDEPETFLARALATRAILPGPLRCNLRMGPLTHPKITQRARRQSIKTALLFMLAGLLLCSVNLTWGRLIKRKEAQIDRTFCSLADELAGYHLTARGDHALAIVRNKLDRRMDLMGPFLKAFEPSLTSTLSGIMEIGKKHELRYETLSLSRDKQVLIRGTSGDWNRCEKLSAYLQQNGFAVKLDRKEALADGMIPFTITSDIK